MFKFKKEVKTLKNAKVEKLNIKELSNVVGGNGDSEPSSMEVPNMAVKSSGVSEPYIPPAKGSH
jgi:bacteriocin-like protein